MLTDAVGDGGRTEDGSCWLKQQPSPLAEAEQHAPGAQPADCDAQAPISAASLADALAGFTAQLQQEAASSDQELEAAQEALRETRPRVAYLHSSAEDVRVAVAVLLTADGGSGARIALRQQVDELLQAYEKLLRQQEERVAALVRLSGAPVRAATAAALASLASLEAAQEGRGKE